MLQLDEGSVQCNSKVVVDTACCFKAEDVVQIDTINRTMDVSKNVGGSKAVIVFFEIDVFKELVRSVNGADVMTSQRLDESVLVSAI